jgi:all-trans-8'-apo-beta-carotenal 15,15'-oxygenase
LKFTDFLKQSPTGAPDMDNLNPANTNVMPVPNSNILYALCEAGSPYRLTKNTLDCQGFDDLGFLKHNYSGQPKYSAHPKIDPENGDVFNFGYRMSTVGI